MHTVLSWVPLLLCGFSENTWELEEFLAKLWPRPWPPLEPAPNCCWFGHVAECTRHTPPTVLESAWSPTVCIQNLAEVQKAVVQLERGIVRKVISWFRWCLVCLAVCCPRDVVRILSCHNIFHEWWCIEPWLLRCRTCLKGKCDLLKATRTEVTVKNEEKSLVALVEDGKGSS